MTSVRIVHGDSLTVLPTLDACSVDSIVTDPPYELGFMGKRWDASGIAYNVTLWRECLRVLKPGGHLLAFGGTRTYHRMACAIEDAGFEIRDSIHWLYGSGFPKSLDVSKAIDKAAGAERSKVRYAARPHTSGTMSGATETRPWIERSRLLGYHEVDGNEPATDAARQWEGWGTALKPAHEPIVVARKPLVGTVAANVLEHGTGALNIDGCRIANTGEPIARVTGAGILGGTTDGYDRPWKRDPAAVAERQRRADLAIEKANEMGRWPANVVIDEAIAEAHPEWGRFFYCPKPNRGERDMGLGALTPNNAPGVCAGRVDGSLEGLVTAARRNFHPTVKPVDLMRWLVRLVTPPNGTVLDPFAGSGTTLVAARLEGFAAVGIEMTADYLPIIEGRVAWAARVGRSWSPERTSEPSPDQLSLFDGLDL